MMINHSSLVQVKRHKTGILPDDQSQPLDAGENHSPLTQVENTQERLVIWPSDWSCAPDTYEQHTGKLA